MCSCAAVAAGLKTGSEVLADGQMIAKRSENWFTRSFGAGYPDLDSLVEQLEKHRTSGAA